MNVLKIVVTVLALVGATWALVFAPVDVPDTSSPPDTNHAGSVNGANTIGQTFVPSRDGLDRIDLGLAVERPTDLAELTFQVTEVPWKQPREATLKTSDLPVGKASDFRPGTIRERWYSLSFEPVPNSAGKKMYFSLEGKDITGPNSVDLLMFFHNSYSLGEAYLNGDALNANVVFRTHGRGNVLTLMQVVLENWSTHIPAPLGNPAVVGGMALLFIGLAATTLRLPRGSS